MPRLPIRSVLLVLAGLAASCGTVAPSPSPRAVRRERPTVPDDGPGAETAAATAAREAKEHLLAVINRERVAHGAGPLAADPFAARVGDLFCRDSARDGYVSHWDLAGRAPYRRFTDLGGFDYHAQNVGAFTVVGGRVKEPLEKLLLDSHALMMAERPPDDGHRRTVLDPAWTHVGIGAAIVGGEFRMTEEYTRRVVEWVEAPPGTLRVGTEAPVGLKLPAGWSVGSVEVAYEPAPVPISREEASRRSSYRYPAAVRSFRPLLGAGFRWSDGDQGDFPASPDGRLRLRVPLTSGPGSYYLLVYAGTGNINGRPLSPVAAIRLDAR